MANNFKSFFNSSQLLTDGDFKAMCKGGKILEQDERGAKVILLTSGDIIKIFRVRRLVSGTRVYSYARRFCRNATRLKACGIHTVTIKKLYHFERSNNTAVLYQPLPGQTLRDVIKKNEVSSDLIQSLGLFLSKLHQKGVHFHSLHTGNVVATPEGELGLIDISDLSIYPWPLFCNTRLRSFRRLCKYPEDIKQFGVVYWELLQDVYFTKSRLSKLCETEIRQSNHQLITF